MAAAEMQQQQQQLELEPEPEPKPSGLQQQLERIVNRWLVDYYYSLAVDAARSDRYADFCGVRDVLERLLSRPLECTEVMPSKIRVLQFLSMINDGEKLDWAFGSDDSTTPLESAIEVLTDLNEVCSIPQEDVEKVCTSIKEMLVVICLKNGKFEKAKDILTRLFPSGMVGKKAILMGLANQKVKSHALLEQSNFKKFKEDMVDFSVQLFPSSVPFLHKAAMQLVDKRLLEQGGGAPEEGEADLADASSDTVALCLVSGFRDQFINKERLVAVYTVMSGTSQPTFSQLEKEYYDSASVALPAPSDGPSQGGGSGSPREASVADLQHADAAAGPSSPSALPQGPVPSQRPRGGYSVAQLLQEPDSLVCTQESAGSQEPAADLDVTQMEVEAEAEPCTVGVAPPESTNKKSPMTPKSCPPRKSDSFEWVDSDSDVCGCSVGKRRKRSRYAAIVDDDVDGNEEGHSSHIDSFSSSPQKTSPEKGKTKGRLLDNASESKATWSDEESTFSSYRGSSNSKKPWSEKESNMLREAVARFGEGNWAKIMARYKFENRTNVNLKDRWRTMKRLKLV